MLTEEFIYQHRMDDVRQLALQGGRYPDVDMPFALQQIDGWQRARKKLPMWAETDGIIYPPHISMEQCSSEQTARYKAKITKTKTKTKTKTLTPQSSVFIDLTGGFGVDFSYMSRDFDHAIYVERQQHLCDIAKHNFLALGLKNTEVICKDAEDYLKEIECSTSQKDRVGVIYLDPARRDNNGKKTYAIEDCTPDVCQMLPRLRKIADRIVIKLSPMLDHREAQHRLDAPMDIHIVSVGNECKEILLDIYDDAEGKVFCVNDDTVFESSLTPQPLSFTPQPLSLLTPPSTKTSPSLGEGQGGSLIVPNASIMKAGCFGEFAEKYGLKALDKNSHLFIGDKAVDYPVARSYNINNVCSLNKKELKAALKDITKANISCRNFPMTPQELRKRLKLKDGGDIYIFATTVRDKHLLFVCRAKFGHL